MIPANQYRWAAPLLDRYNRHLLRKSFATVRVAGLAPIRSLQQPAILAPNHSCWWDGCVDLYLSRQILKITGYLMMGETELSRHRVFSSLGVFSVAEEGRDSVSSLRYIIDELKAPASPRILWLYPEGEMRPARSAIQPKAGILVIAERTASPIIPVAHRYEFLREDHPEVLVRIGQPISGLSRKSGGLATLATAMTELLQQLDHDIVSGHLDEYETVLTGPVSREKRLRRLVDGVD